MTVQQPHPTLERLTTAYGHMLERLHAAFTPTEAHTPLLRRGLEQARDTAVELGELTREEAERLATYLERDVHDAALYIADTGQELRAWWRFDLELVEDRLLELFISVADQTSVQIQEMNAVLEQTAGYFAGEITGPGRLTCVDCGQEIYFTQPSSIQPCPRCGGEEFNREYPDGTPF